MRFKQISKQLHFAVHQIR